MRIGRAKDNTLRGEDRRISRHHAVVRRTNDGEYEVEDLGSSYGTFVNGRTVKKEMLKHRDIVRCGGLTIQFLLDAASESGTNEQSGDPSTLTATLDNLFEARAQIRRLIDEHAVLRSEVGTAQQAEDVAKQQRDEAQHEAERLHKIVAEQRKELANLQERVDELGRELRERLSSKNETPPAVEALQQQLAEAQRQAERYKNRVLEIEERDSARLASELALRKEVERLGEQIKQREQREAQLTQAVKPALMRIAELTKELELLHIKLAETQAELSDLKRR